MGILFCKQKPAESTKSKTEQYDFYRCSNLRYMGFSSIIASKMVPPAFAHIPQMAATAYIFSDVFNKTIISVENEDDPQRTVVTAVDAFLWQTMCSVLAPLLLYGSLKSATKLAFLRKPKVPPIQKTKCKTKMKAVNNCDKPIPPPPKPIPPKAQCVKAIAPPSRCGKSEPPPSTPKCKKPEPPPPKTHCADPPPKVEQCNLNSKANVEPAFVRILPGVISLLLMPFIIKPIQNGADNLLDATYRKWTEDYLKVNELPLEERRERERAKRLRAAQLAKEAEEKRKKEELVQKAKMKEAEKIAAEKAKQKAKEEELAKAKRLIEEKEAKARAKLQCLEEEKIRKDKLAAEERALKETLKQQEIELAEKKAKMEREFKEKVQKQTDCD